MKKEPSPERCAVVMDDGWRRFYYPIKVSATGGQVCHLGPRFHPSFLWFFFLFLDDEWWTWNNLKEYYHQDEDGSIFYKAMTECRVGCARFLKRTEMRKW